jgi:hypothetical protein
MSEDGRVHPDDELDPTDPDKWIDAILEDCPGLMTSMNRRNRGVLIKWLAKALIAGHDYGWDRCICGHPKKMRK